MSRGGGNNTYTQTSMQLKELAEAMNYKIPVVLEQKTTILWKLLYLLASNQRVSHLSSGMSTRVEGVDENHS